MKLHEQRPELGIILKIEVAKAPVKSRWQVEEVAFVMEEMLRAVELGKDRLPAQNEHRRILNKAIEEKKLKEKAER